MRRDWLLLALALKGSAQAVDLERFAAAGLLDRALEDSKAESGLTRFDAAVAAAEALLAAAITLESNLGKRALVVDHGKSTAPVSVHHRQSITQVVPVSHVAYLVYVFILHFLFLNRCVI